LTKQWATFGRLLGDFLGDFFEKLILSPCPKAINQEMRETDLKPSPADFSETNDGPKIETVYIRFLVRDPAIRATR
jgi:hypothetical protein